MALLDANIPQLQVSHASFADQATQFMSIVHQAEQSAMQAQAFHQGESSVAFQQAHGQFTEISHKMQTLLQLAGNNIQEGATTYQVQDGQGASDMVHTLGQLPGAMPGLH
jgi:uncharacterized protein YukE